MAEKHFDPENISDSDMKALANHIDRYINEMVKCMVIPEELYKDEEDIEEAIKRGKELVKLMRKGKKKIFKDPDEWKLIS